MTVAWAVAVAVLPLLFLMAALTPVWLQLAILVGGLAIAEGLGGSRRAILPVAIGSFLLAYVILGVSHRRTVSGVRTAAGAVPV